MCQKINNKIGEAEQLRTSANYCHISGASFAVIVWPLVNGVAVSAFSVYLFHCHPAIRGWISQEWTSINETCGPYLSILVAVVSFIVIFAFCCAVDRLRIYSFKIMSNTLFHHGKG